MGFKKLLRRIINIIINKLLISSDLSIIINKLLSNSDDHSNIINKLLSNSDDHSNIINKLLSNSDDHSNIINKLLNSTDDLKRKLDAMTDDVTDHVYGYADKGTQMLLALKYRQLYELGKILPFEEVEFRNHSQNGEDGILWYIYSLIGTTNKKAVEICAGNGKECNTANLVVNHGWNVLMVERDGTNADFAKKYYAKHPDTFLIPPTVVNDWITAENVNDIIKRNGFAGEIDFLSIDIDGVDYWLWKAIDVATPRVVMVEIQVVWRCAESLPAFIKLAKEKGYRLIGANRSGINVVFMRNDVGVDVFPEIDQESVFSKAYSVVSKLGYDNNIYRPECRSKYTKYNIPSRDDVPYIINIIYEDIFGYKTDGIFVEIGAYDGETSSFTCFLADTGWSGHYIEPIERNFIKCLKRHEKNKVLCYNYFIGNIVGKSTMFDYGPFSRKNVVNNFKAIPAFSKEAGESVDINCLAMDMFLKNKEIPREIDLLLIDVEDGEINVLKSFSLLGKEYNPTAIIIETTHQNETKAILTSAGYVQYCSLDTDDFWTKNLVFVSRNRANGKFPLLNKMKEMRKIPLLNKMKEMKIINFSDIDS